MDSGFGQPAIGGPIRDALTTAVNQSRGYVHPDTLANMNAAPAPTGTIGSPQGNIRTDVIGYGTGGPWENYNAFDPEFTKYGQQFGVDPAVLKAMMVVESGGAAGTPDNGWGTGVMQVQPEWEAEAQRLGLPSVSTPEGQVAMAAAILGGQASLGQPTVEGDWETNFRNIFFPSDVELRTGSGITQDQYVNAVNTLAGDIHAADPTGGGQLSPSPGMPTEATLSPGPNSGSQNELPPLSSGDPGGLGLPVIQGPQEGGWGNLGTTQPDGQSLSMEVAAPGAGTDMATTSAPPQFNTSMLTDKGYAEGPTFILADPNPIPNYQPEFVVFHITDGEGDPSTGGTGIYGSGSTNYMIGRDGTI
jgi:hypothetical protein